MTVEAQPAAPTSRPVTGPAQHGEVKNAASGKGPGAIGGKAGPTERVLTAREQLKAVGQGMKDGTIQSKFEHIPTKAPVRGQPGQQQPHVTAPGSGHQDPAAGRQVARPAEGQETAPTAEEKAAASESAKALNTAKRILVRDGWTAEDFAGKDPAALIARAEQRKAVHAESDRVFGEHATLKRAAPQPRAADGTFTEKTIDPATGKPAEAAPGAQAGNVTADPTVEGVLAKLEATAGKETADTFRNLVTAIQKNSTVESQTATFLAQSIMTTQGKAIFAASYPDLATDPDNFQAVKEMYTALLPTGAYTTDNLDKAWSDAANIVHGPPNEVQNAQRTMLARQTGALNGRVEVGENRSSVAESQPLSKREQLKRAGELMKQNPNATLAELRKMLPTR